MDLQPGQIALIFTPVTDGDEWTGEIHTGLAFGEENLPEAMAAAMDHAITMAATTMFLEDNPEFEDDFDDIKAALLESMFPEQYASALAEVDQEEREANKDYGENVVNLKWWTKTQGNA